MPLSSDIYPLLSGPSLRFLAPWIELVTAALALPCSVSITCFVVFGLTLFLTVAFRRRKTRKFARGLEQKYNLTPSVAIIVVDLLFGLGFCRFGCRTCCLGANREHDAQISKPTVDETDLRQYPCAQIVKVRVW